MANDRTNMVSLLDFGKWMGGTTSNIIELGDGVTELTEDWGPEMSEVQYVNMKTKSNTLNGYAFSTTVEREHMSDEAQEFIDDSFRKFPTGKDAETFYYRFYKTDKITDGKFKAIRLPVVAAPSSTGGSGGETLVSSLQLTGNGSVIEGTITIADGTYTFAEGTSEAAPAAFSARSKSSDSKSNLS